MYRILQLLSIIHLLQEPSDSTESFSFHKTLQLLQNPDQLLQHPSASTASFSFFRILKLLLDPSASTTSFSFYRPPLDFSGYLNFFRIIQLLQDRFVSFYRILQLLQDPSASTGPFSFYRTHQLLQDPLQGPPPPNETKSPLIIHKIVSWLGGLSPFGSEALLNNLRTLFKQQFYNISFC